MESQDVFESFKQLAKNTRAEIQQNLKIDSNNANGEAYMMTKKVSFFEIDKEAVIQQREEIVKSIHRWFSSLIDAKVPEISIAGFEKDVVLKDLNKQELQRKNYLLSEQSQRYGKSVMLIDYIANRMVITPCKIIRAEYLDGIVKRITISTGIDYPLGDSDSKYNYMISFVLDGDKVYKKTWWADTKGKIDVIAATSQKLFSEYKLLNVDEPKLCYSGVDEIPCIAILSNNYLEEPTTSPVEMKLWQAANYDAVLNNLPQWEAGIFVTADFAVTSMQQGSLELQEILKEKTHAVSLKGLDSELGVADLARFLQPASIQQTTLNSLQEIMRSIRQTLGIPALDEVKSAQQTKDEIYQSQMMSSPQIEQRMRMQERYFAKLIYNFIWVAKLNHVTDYETVDLNKINVDVTFDSPLATQTTNVKDNQTKNNETEELTNE